MDLLDTFLSVKFTYLLNMIPTLLKGLHEYWHFVSEIIITMDAMLAILDR